MSDLKSAAKLALEALEKSVGAMRGLYGGWRCEAPLKAADAAITSIRQAIAEAENQEPVAWWIPKAEQFCLPNANGERPFAKAWEPLYTTPQQRKPPKAGDGSALFYEAVRLLDNAIFAQSGDVVRHDSAAHREALDFFNHVFTQLDSPPAPQQRKPLTDEQIDKAMAENKQILIDAADDYWKMRRAYARIIEAAHGINE